MAFRTFMAYTTFQIPVEGANIPNVFHIRGANLRNRGANLRNTPCDIIYGVVTRSSLVAKSFRYPDKFPGIENFFKLSFQTGFFDNDI
jgi:hypothetical protein